MAFFKNLFSSNQSDENSKNSFPWKALMNVSQLDEIEKESTNEPVFIFKHSTRCGISRMVLGRFEEKFANNQEGMQFYYLDLLNFREISGEIAARFQVMHQSPQLLVIKNGDCVAHASHYEILEMEV